MTCPICDGKGYCNECIDGTVESYYQLQRIGFAALEDESVSEVVEQIDAVDPDDANRALIVDYLARLALQRIRVAP